LLPGLPPPPPQAVNTIVNKTKTKDRRRFMNISSQ
jgi:hypothetical protein